MKKQRSIQCPSLAQYSLHAIFPTCNIPYMQYSIHAIFPTCNIPYMQFSLHAIFPTCNIPYMQYSLHAILSMWIMKIMYTHKLWFKPENIRYLLINKARAMTKENVLLQWETPHQSAYSVQWILILGLVCKTITLKCNNHHKTRKWTAPSKLSTSITFMF